MPLRIGRLELLPLLLPLGPLVQRRAHVIVHPVGHVERLVGRPAQLPLRPLHLVGAEGRAVGRGGVLLVRAAVANVGRDHDEGRSVRLGLCCLEGRVDALQVRPVVHVLHVPVVGLEACAHILREGEVRVAVDANFVVVVKVDQLPETLMTGQ